jgi:MYXO-CTERM domain-containing protein
MDAGPFDAGPLDAGPDAGPLDAGPLDAGDGGPRDGGDDAGPLDAGYDAGYDAGPKPPPGEGFSCEPSAPDCQGDLLCVPYPSFPDYGTCRAACDDSADAGGCFPGRTCQTIYDRTQLAPLYSACAPPTTYRDGACQAPLDEDACTNGLLCLVTRVANAEGDTSMNCKVTCDLDADDAGCADGERCFLTTLIQEVQEDVAGNTITCDLIACEVGGAACPCDQSAGFACLETLAGGVCASAPGECATPVEGLAIDDLTDAGFIPFERLCNTVSGHRVCDNEPFEGLDNPGVNTCLFQGQLGINDEGLCLPFCGNASFDDNNNGLIEPTEVETILDCPAGQVCTRRLARELLLGPGPPDLFGPFGVKGCQVADCPAGLPCALCGPGEVECLTLPGGPEQGFDGVCVAPTRTCDYPPDGFDDGPVFALDAGPQDAGYDAGPEDAGYDAGSARPSGPGLGQGGGPTVNRGGDCGCSSSGDDGRPAVLAFALLAGAVVLRRRRR